MSPLRSSHQTPQIPQEHEFHDVICAACLRVGLGLQTRTDVTTYRVSGADLSTRGVGAQWQVTTWGGYSVTIDDKAHCDRVHFLSLT